MTSRRAVSTTARSPWGAWLPWAALALLATLPYLRSVDYPLLHDDRAVLSNPWLAREATAATVWSSDFFHDRRHEGTKLYRPLTTLSLAWNVRLAPSRAGIRGVNVALHALTTLLVAAVLAAVLRRSRGGTRPDSPFPFAAWAGASLFAVHPLGSEAVLWAVGRAEILAAAFGLIAFVLALDLEDRPGSGGWRYAASLVAFFLALASKESAASWLPLGVAGYALLPRGGPSPGSRAAIWRGAGYVAVLALFVGLRGAALGWGAPATHFVDNPLVMVDPATRVANAALLLGRYAMKVVWPFPLSIEYGYDQIRVVPLLPWGALAALSLAATWTVAVFVFVRRSRVAAFFWVFFPVAFAVTGNVLMPIGTILADRLAYLPLVGACGLAGMAVARLGEPRRARTAAIAVLLALLAARTWERSGDYRDLLTLREATAASSPRAVKALVNVGRARLRAGRPADAVGPLERAVSIWPDYARAWELLAGAYAASGRADLAETAARQARETSMRGATPDDEREGPGSDSAVEGVPGPVR